MISNYINNWLEVIENMKNDTTYKLAWGRAIIECIYSDKCYVEAEEVYITLEAIAECMLKYYWNQLFFFNLKQSANDKKPPIICQLTNALIDEYKRITNSSIPVWFDKALNVFADHQEIYQKTIKDIVKVLPNDVSWCFKYINKKVMPLYEYNNKKREDKITLNYSAAKELKEYSFVISKLLNYKWAQLLEKFNFAPKIASKVNGISNTKLKRNALTKYKNELLKLHNGQAIDFYTGEVLEKNNISVDHVIPWSFMYSDDIWNLVLTSKSNNSSKSNSIPSSEVIEKLKERNNLLLQYVEGSFKHDLEEAIKMNYIDKFYYECRL